MAVAALCPVAMLFVRCKGGISHAPEEFLGPADAEIAVSVLIEFLRNFQTDMSIMNEAVIQEKIIRSADAAQEFLGALVRAPSDNPAGDCAPHAEHTAQLLEALGFEVERHVVPAETVRAHGMISATNLIVRHRFGPGPVIALNAHGDVVPPGDWLEHGPVRRRN